MKYNFDTTINNVPVAELNWVVSAGHSAESDLTPSTRGPMMSSGYELFFFLLTEVGRMKIYIISPVNFPCEFQNLVSETFPFP